MSYKYDNQHLLINDFSISDGILTGISGDNISINASPAIQVKVASTGLMDKPVTLSLIKMGTVIKTIRGKPPLKLTYNDQLENS